MAESGLRAEVLRKESEDGGDDAGEKAPLPFIEPLGK